MSIRLVWLSLLFVAIPGYGSQSVFGRDGIQSIQLSPSGEHFAFLKRQSNTDELFIVDTSATAISNQRIWREPQRIQSFAWVDNERLVLQIGEDVQHELEPQRTGEIEILPITGESSRVGGTDSSDTKVQQALAGKELIVVDGLPSIAGVLLVNDQTQRGLWLLDIQSDTVDTFEYPPLELAEFTISPNLDFMAAVGVGDTGSRRVMSWRRSDDANWTDLEPSILPVSISNTGTLYAHKPDMSGVEGLVAITLSSGALDSLFQDDTHDIDQVLVDRFNVPFAARYLPGYPSWFYMSDDHRLTKLHKSIRAATPENDVSFVSSSIDGSRFIAEIIKDNRPSSFFLFDANSGRTQRLLESQSSLWVVGGEIDQAYTLRPFNIPSGSGSEISGYVSLPKNASANPRPTVVILRDMIDAPRWKWGFDQEVWFFHRQGFNVLMVNRTVTTEIDDASVSTDHDVLISNMEDAIGWMTENDLIYRNRICLYGRGAAAETALLAALRSDKCDCAISLDGEFETPNLIVEAARLESSNNRDLAILFVYGADSDNDNTDTPENLRISLSALDIEVGGMPLTDVSSTFSDSQKEVRSFAQASSFLKNQIGRRSTWPTLPLTYQQNLVMSDLMEIFITRAQEEFHTSRNWRKWFEENDDAVRQSLTDAQLSIYESYQAEMINLTEDMRPGERLPPLMKAIDRPWPGQQPRHIVGQ